MFISILCILFASATVASNPSQQAPGGPLVALCRRVHHRMFGPLVAKRSGSSAKVVLFLVVLLYSPQVAITSGVATSG